MSTDPRHDAWQQRKIAVEKLALLRMYQGALSGCQRCGDAERIEELRALVARAVEAVAELTGLCSTRPISASLPA